MIDSIASTTSSIVVTAGIGGSGGGVAAAPDGVALGHDSGRFMLLVAPSDLHDGYDAGADTDDGIILQSRSH